MRCVYKPPIKTTFDQIWGGDLFWVEDLLFMKLLYKEEGVVVTGTSAGTTRIFALKQEVKRERSLGITLLEEGKCT